MNFSLLTLFGIVALHVLKGGMKNEVFFEVPEFKDIIEVDIRFYSYCLYPDRRRAFLRI